MNTQDVVRVQCPYCGERINLLVDCSVPEQQYIEDCQVCCSPITVVVRVDERTGLSVAARHENE